MTQPRPIVALLTDFGLRDHYVASMKGIILGIAPEAALVDITHEVPPQDIVSAAFELAACWRDFPAGTVFLVVVDPGVGTERRAIAARAGGRAFVAPDNGVLAPILDEPGSLVVHLTERRFARPEVSNTFEGRDRFAPAAAWLAKGTDLRDMGPVVDSWVPLDAPKARVEDRAIVGEIVSVDRFGNLISNIDRRMLESSAVTSAFVSIEGHELPGVVRTYGEVTAGGLCALIGSAGYLEIAVNGGSAASTLRLGRGARVRIGPGPCR